MYLSTLTIENFRCFGQGAKRLELRLRPGLTALVGENDKGKSAIIDALRFALGTTDHEWFRLEETDFHASGEKMSREIKIVCKFEALTSWDKRAFLEYLTYGETAGDEPVLYVNWTAEDTGEIRKGQPYRRVEVCSGRNGNGPTMVGEVRDLLRAIYLRPLRDAEQSLSAGRGSRLAQVLRHADLIREGLHEYDLSLPLDDQKLSVLGIGKLVNALLEEQEGVKGTRSEIDRNLRRLSLRGDVLASDIKVSGQNASDEARVRELLEKLDLRLDGAGKLGLGSHNLLFMACELLLLAQEDEGSRLLLIEEPEAHLHAQRQLRVMQFLQDQAREKGIQIVVTTHSPNLASAVRLDSLVMIHSGRAFPMARGETLLEPSDYRFLQRFLDVTKANLFFARGVMIVEGDAESILISTLARLLDRDLTEHGISIVNVGGIGLRRYARIFQRSGVGQGEKDLQLPIPVACIADMDVMPDCAGEITGVSVQTRSTLGSEGLSARRKKLRNRASGQYVKTFVSDEWTFEYDLALSGLAEDVYVAAYLAKQEDTFDGTLLRTVVRARKQALAQFAALRVQASNDVAGGKVSGCSCEEVVAARVYAQFTKGMRASKAIAAQYLAELLERKRRKKELTAASLRALLPDYLTRAIDYVTGFADPPEAAPNEEGICDE